MTAQGADGYAMANNHLTNAAFNDFHKTIVEKTTAILTKFFFSNRILVFQE